MNLNENRISLPDKRYWAPVAILIGTFAVTSFIMSFVKPPEKKTEEKALPLVDFVVAQKATHNMGVGSQGMVKPFMETQLVAEVSGRVTNISSEFVAGAFVKKGDLLMTIEQTDYIAEVNIAKANLVRAQARLSQEKALSEQAEKDWQSLGNRSNNALAARQVQVNQQLADVRQAEAQLTRAKRNLSRTEVRAPYDGIVRARNVNLGQYLNLGSMVATVADISLAEVRLPVPEVELGYLENQNLKADQRPVVELISSGSGEIKSWNAYLERSEGVIDDRTRMVYMVARFPDPYGLNPSTINQSPLRYGTYVNAQISGKDIEAFKIPRFTINSNSEVVLVDKENQLQRTKVEIYRQDYEYAYVVNGLADGDQIVTTALDNPLNGTKVELKLELDESESLGDVSDEAELVVEEATDAAVNQAAENETAQLN